MEQDYTTVVNKGSLVTSTLRIKTGDACLLYARFQGVPVYMYGRVQSTPPSRPTAFVMDVWSRLFGDNQPHVQIVPANTIMTALTTAQLEAARVNGYDPTDRSALAVLGGMAAPGQA